MLRPENNTSQGTMRTIRPRGTAELNKLATIEINPRINIKHYFRSADILIKQARVYYNEKDYENALGLTELSRHPSYKAPEHKRQNKVIKLNCLEALNALETLKPKLDKLFEDHLEDINKNNNSNHNIPSRKQSTRVANRKTSVSSESLKIEVEANVPEEGKVQVEEDTQEKKKRSDNEQWSVQNALRGVSGIGGTTGSENEQNKQRDLSNAQANYPKTNIYNQSDSFNYIKSPTPSAPSYAPPLPPKPMAEDSEPIIKPVSVPPLPPKIRNEPQFESKGPVISDQFVPKLPPKIKLDQQDETHSSPASTTEGGLPLRYLYLPDSLQKDFLRIAQTNTSKNIETCGILCGTLKNNVLTVTTMIIPRQSGTPDSCTTENEEELFDYQDSHELLTFGWIHTHPSQSCFLSSLDLHTHCSYQIMLPEAVAIVCAPKHNPSYGIFRLTDPPGLPLITNCKVEGAFHPHPDEPIYTDTHNDTGHVRIKNYSYDIVDLRG
ncbi:hypothetical protein BDC45DRAFT_569553 [Circinella umbellata]|nr:hypothetical protein BDC45DRAFT_569553 [Circinella umbellata]